MKPIHYAALLILGAIWGASFLFIGIAVPDFGPLSLMFLRVLAAGLILLVVAALTKQPKSIHDSIQVKKNWRKYLIVGLLNCALPFTLIAYAELKVTASLAAILQEVGPTRIASVTFLIPMFGTLWGIVFLDEPFSAGMLLGMAIILISISFVMGVQFDRWNFKRYLKTSETNET